MKKTLVLGASPNPIRFSHKAVKSLVRHGHEVVPIGIREGDIMWQKIIVGKPKINDIHTITIYLNPTNQEEYYDYIIRLKPKRIIFNPGSENQELIELAMQKDIEVIIACTLIMLNNHQY
ncbi:MAG TPA: CoA-binding protein [Bacteroidales bacterium]|nr:CoA-binding protein [Bacteroidales bacterium]